MYYIYLHNQQFMTTRIHGVTSDKVQISHSHYFFCVEMENCVLYNQLLMCRKLPVLLLIPYLLFICDSFFYDLTV